MSDPKPKAEKDANSPPETPATAPSTGKPAAGTPSPGTFKGVDLSGWHALASAVEDEKRAANGVKPPTPNASTNGNGTAAGGTSPEVDGGDAGYAAPSKYPVELREPPATEDEAIRQAAGMSRLDYYAVRVPWSRHCGFHTVKDFDVRVEHERKRMKAEAEAAAGFKIGDKPDPHAPAHKSPRIPDSDGMIFPDGFAMQKGGLIYLPLPRPDGPEPDPVWVAAPFKVIAESSDDTDHIHGLLLSWQSSNGRQHQWAMPQRMVHADGNGIAAELQDAGLRFGASRAQHELLKNFLGSVRSQHRVRCVDRAGWHGAAFVLPDGRVVGAAASVVLQTEHIMNSGAFTARGTLSDWKDKVGSYAAGNDLMALVISAGFAAPLLDIMNEPSGGLHLVNVSRSGKSTLLGAAASIHGPGEMGAQIRSWRATANGLEAVAAETCDLLLILDEIAQANGREVGDVIYMLSNQVGKARANRAGGARRHKTWRTLFLSSGEITPAAKIAEAGIRTHAGQDVRLVSLSADAGAGMGVFQQLHGMASAEALANHLRDAARTCCGTAGPAFLEKLVRDRADDAALTTGTLQTLREQFLQAHLPAEADGQVRSVASRFALIAVAGELAQAYGVVPQERGDAGRGRLLSTLAQGPRRHWRRRGHASD